MKNQLIVISVAMFLVALIVFTTAIFSRYLNMERIDGNIDVRANTEDKLPTDTTVSESVPMPSGIDQVANSDQGTISIPGYDTLRMKADQREQQIHFYNPEGNKCYFMITLYLPDGKEIYRSDLIAPGQAVSQIRLISEVSAGIYGDATLMYSCYALDTLQSMNGASVKITLEVL